MEEKVGLNLDVIAGRNDAKAIAQDVDIATESIRRLIESLQELQSINIGPTLSGVQGVQGAGAAGSAQAPTGQSDKFYESESARYRSESAASKIEEQQLRLQRQQLSLDEKNQRRAELERTRLMQGGRSAFGGTAGAIASFGSHDPMGATGGIASLAGRGLKMAGGLLGKGAAAAGGAGILGALGTGLGILGGGLLAGGVAAYGVNALSKQYEQFAPLLENAQLTGRLAGSSDSKANDEFDIALQRAAASAMRFGIKIEEAGQIQRQAMRTLDITDSDEMSLATDKALRMRNAYGANVGLSLELDSMKRYGGTGDFSATAIAAHQGLVDRGQQTNATLGETQQEMAKIARNLVDKGYAPDAEATAKATLMFTGLKMQGSDKNYTTAQSGRMVEKINRGLAAAADGNTDDSLVPLSAAMGLSKGNLLDAQIMMEEGLAGENGKKLLEGTIAGLSYMPEDSKIRYLSKNLNISMGEAKSLYEDFKDGGISDAKMSELKSINAGETDMQKIVGATEAIRAHTADMVKDTTALKSGILSWIVEKMPNSKTAKLIHRIEAQRKYGEKEPKELDQIKKEEEKKFSLSSPFSEVAAGDLAGKTYDKTLTTGEFIGGAFGRLKAKGKLGDKDFSKFYDFASSSIDTFHRSGRIDKSDGLQYGEKLEIARYLEEIAKNTAENIKQINTVNTENQRRTTQQDAENVASQSGQPDYYATY